MGIFKKWFKKSDPKKEEEIFAFGQEEQTEEAPEYPESRYTEEYKEFVEEKDKDIPEVKAEAEPETEEVPEASEEIDPFADLAAMEDDPEENE